MKKLKSIAFLFYSLSFLSTLAMQRDLERQKHKAFNINFTAWRILCEYFNPELTSPVCKKFNEVNNAELEKRWNWLKKVYNTRYLQSLVNKIEKSRQSEEVSYKHFIDLYKNLISLSGEPMPKIKPDDLDITHPNTFIQLDQSIHKVQDDCLSLIWPSIRKQIIEQAKVSIRSGLSPEQARAWLSNPENSSVLQKVKKLELSGFMSTRMLFELSLFTNLEELDLSISDLILVDLSSFKRLKSLDLSQSNLLEINLKGLTELQYLNLGFNPLTKINLSDQAKLKHLDISGNDLNLIDIAHLQDLEILDLAVNNLEDINLSNLIQLKSLDISHNKLKILDLSMLAKLEYLYISENQLTKESINLPYSIWWNLKTYENKKQKTEVSSFCTIS